MNRFQQLTNGFGQFVQTMTPGLRVVALLLVVVIVVSLTLLFQQAHVTTTELLFDGQSFTQWELQRIEVAFAKAKLSDHEIVGRVVRIPSNSRTEYINAIAEAGILGPAQTHAVDAINAKSIFELPTQNRARIEMAKQQDLAEVIRKLPSVEEAWVSVNVEEVSRLPRKVNVSASVKVQCGNGTKLTPGTAQMIRQIVASEYEEVTPVDVGVFDLSSGKSHSAGEQIESALVANHEDLRNDQRERHLQETVERSLHAYPGARVVVNTRLNATTEPRPEQICVFIQIPRSYYIRSWGAKENVLPSQARNGTGNQQLSLLRKSTESKVKQDIQQLCGDGIVVAVSSFDDSLQSPPNRIQAISHWLATGWPMVLGVGAMLFFVWNVRSGMNPQTSSHTDDSTANTRQAEAQPTVNGLDQNVDAQGVPSVPTIDIHTGQLRERLSSVVRNDPDAAAKVLQDWMKEAS